MGSLSFRVGPMNLNISFKDMERFFKVWQKNMQQGREIEAEEEKEAKAAKASKKEATKAPAVVQNYPPAQAAPAIISNRQALVENTAPPMIRAEVIDGELEDYEVVTEDGTVVAAKKMRATEVVDPYSC